MEEGLAAENNEVKEQVLQQTPSKLPEFLTRLAICPTATPGCVC